MAARRKRPVCWEPPERMPITGIADCCARAASGHAAEHRHKLAPSYVEHGGFLAQSVRRTLSLPPNGGRVAAVHCLTRADGPSGSFTTGVPSSHNAPKTGRKFKPSVSTLCARRRHSVTYEV